MSEEKPTPEDLIHQLQKENRELRASNENLLQSQVSYEQLIGNNNESLLRSDMARMELEQIFSANTDATWVIREDGIVLRANEAMLKMLGKTAEQTIGQKCSEMIGYGHCEHDDCPLQCLRQQRPCEQDVQLALPATEGRHYLLTSAPLITLDGTPGTVVQFKDITSRKLAEAALERMVHIDGLTQIANRRRFDELLRIEWQRLRRDQQPLSLLLCDIDYFKKFNDHYGHQAGDDCLKLVAKALEKTLLRPADLAARYGGEEFVLLLPGTENDGALNVGSRALEAARQLGIKHQKSEVSEVVTISMGVATLRPSTEQSPETLIALADQALYKAKELGRDRIVNAAPTAIRDDQ